MQYNGPLSSPWKRTFIMMPNPLFYQFLMVALIYPHLPPHPCRAAR
jgi:hypothetical protein